MFENNDISLVSCNAHDASSTAVVLKFALMLMLNNGQLHFHGIMNDKNSEEQGFVRMGQTVGLIGVDEVCRLL